MKYTIISIDDSRLEYKDKIRQEMGNDEIFVDCLDARPETVDLEEELANIGLHFADYWKSFPWSRGDIGGYVSHFNAWQKAVEIDEPLLVFEDDAILPDGFLANVESLLEEVPEGYGAVGLSVHPFEFDSYNHH